MPSTKAHQRQPPRREQSIPSAFDEADIVFTNLHTPIGSGATMEEDDVDDWLDSPNIPAESSRLLLLSQKYFEHVHTIRCYSFLHQPTFFQALDDDTAETLYGSALLHMICAFGALYVDQAAPAIGTDDALPGHTSRARTNTGEPQAVEKCRPGQAWAAKAEAMLLLAMGQPTVIHLQVSPGVIEKMRCTVLITATGACITVGV